MDSFRHFLYAVILAFSCSTPSAGSAEADLQSQTLTREEYLCFGRAMVGMDSVINARMGIPPEHALALALISPDDSETGDMYSPDLLEIILSAYLWKGSPEAYSIRVLYKCAISQAQSGSAKSE